MLPKLPDSQKVKKRKKYEYVYGYAKHRKIQLIKYIYVYVYIYKLAAAISLERVKLNVLVAALKSAVGNFSLCCSFQFIMAL